MSQRVEIKKLVLKTLTEEHAGKFQDLINAYVKEQKSDNHKPRISPKHLTAYKLSMKNLTGGVSWWANRKLVGGAAITYFEDIDDVDGTEPAFLTDDDYVEYANLCLPYLGGTNAAIVTHWIRVLTLAAFHPEKTGVGLVLSENNAANDVIASAGLSMIKTPHNLKPIIERRLTKLQTDQQVIAWTALPSNYPKLAFQLLRFHENPILCRMNRKTKTPEIWEVDTSGLVLFKYGLEFLQALARDWRSMRVVQSENINKDDPDD